MRLTLAATSKLFHHSETHNLHFKAPPSPKKKKKIGWTKCTILCLKKWHHFEVYFNNMGLDFLLKCLFSLFHSLSQWFINRIPTVPVQPISPSFTQVLQCPCSLFHPLSTLVLQCPSSLFHPLSHWSYSVRLAYFTLSHTGPTVSV